MIRSTAGRSQNLTAAAVEPRPIQLHLMTQLQYVALQRHVDALDRLVLLFQNLHRTSVFQFTKRLRAIKNHPSVLRNQKRKTLLFQNHQDADQ